MTSPISNTGPSASDKSSRSDTVLTLATARSMVPLVQRIVQDIIHIRQELARLQPEQNRLDSQRRTLDWPNRSRRYQLREEITQQEHALSEAMNELEGLGVSLLDSVKAQLGFPTLVNGRKAFFSWRVGEEGLKHWHFAGERIRRLIPATWNVEADAASVE
jgi:hypothetical protein